MRMVCACLFVALLSAPAAFGQAKEEVETYLVAPYTMNKAVTITLADGTRTEGRVVAGDDDKITVEQQGGGRTELRTERIASVRFHRPGRNAKADFFGSLFGGVGLGFAGAAIGKAAAESIRDDGTPGRAGPLIGGIAFGFAGSYIGRAIARGASSEEVTLVVTHGVEGQAPKVGAIRLPEPLSSSRVEPVDARRQ